MATLTATVRLNEAEDVLHRLQMGENEVSVMRNGKSATYNIASIPQLEKYIATLKGEMGLTSRRGALSVGV